MLIAWVAWEWMGFPRWLAVWLAIPGLLGLVLFILLATDSPSALLITILMLYDIGRISLSVAMAVKFWRPSATLVGSAASTAAAI